MKNYDNLVPPMLEDGLSVLIYEGVEDLICNWSATCLHNLAELNPYG